MTVNAENILRVADAIEAHSTPGLGFNMGTFIGKADGLMQDLSGHNCGTVACVAGWSYAVRNAEVAPAPVNVGDFDWEAEGEWFGLDREAADQLFYGYASADTTTPEQAVAVLRHLAATGEVDWTV